MDETKRYITCLHLACHKNARPEPHIVHVPFCLQHQSWLQRDRHWSSSKSATSWVRGRVQVHTTFFDKLHFEIYTRYWASQIPPQWYPKRNYMWKAMKFVLRGHPESQRYTTIVRWYFFRNILVTSHACICLWL